MGGGGRRKSAPAPVYTPPPPDNSFSKFLEYTQAQEQRDTKRADDERIRAEAKETAKKAFGAAGFAGLRSGLESQLKQGLITYADASGQLRAYGDTYELNPEDAVNNLTKLYTEEVVPGKRARGTAAAYRELLGRDATEEEKKNASDYSSVQDLKDSLLKGSEYQEKFNRSYLDNYYDTMYGKEEKDTEGKRTGKRAFKFDSSLLPTYAAGTEGKAGVSIPTFNDESLNIAGIENREQSIRDTRKYLYSAGLTNLQGDIDKETQKLKNEGAKDVARIGAAGDLYKGLVGSFSF